MLARKAFLIFLVKIFSFLTNVVAWFFLSRRLGPAEIGKYAFVYSFIAIFGSLGDLGFNASHLKRVSEGINLGRAIGTFAFIKILLGLILTVVILGSIGAINLFRLPFSLPAVDFLFFVLFVSFILQNITLILTLTFEARREAAKLTAVNFGQFFFYFLALLTVAFFYPYALGLGVSFFIQILAGFLFALFLFKKYPILSPDYALIKSYSAFAFPLACLIFIGPLEYNLEKILIQNFKGSLEVGLFFGAQKFIVFILMISDPLLNLFTSQISSHHTQKRLDLIHDLLFRSQRYLSLIVTPIIIYSIFQSRTILQIFLGEKFSPAWGILIFLLIQSFFYTLNRPVAVMFLGIDKPKILSLLSLSLLPLGIIFNLMMIPKFGALGASLTLAITSFLGLLSTFFLAYKTINYFPSLKLILHLLAGFIAVAAALSVIKLFAFNLILGFFTGALLTETIYLLILISIREFTKKDFCFFLSLINPKTMKNYIVSELKT